MSKKKGIISLVLLIGFGSLILLILSRKEVSVEGHYESRTAIAPKNVILITVDNLRPDVLKSPVGQGSFASQMSQLASHGATFDNYFQSTPLAVPNLASLLTGLYPPQHGVRDDGHFSLPETLETFPEILKKAGYETAAFIGSTAYPKRLGLGQGFDLYDDTPLEAGGIQKDFFPLKLKASQVNQKVFRFLGGRKSATPFFLWIHYADLMPPYSRDAASLTAHESYEKAVGELDSGIGELTQFLKGHGLLDNSLVVITGTKPQNLGEHREALPGVYLYDTDLKVPLIFSNPRVFSGLLNISILARGVDLMPTLLEMLALAPSTVRDGESLVPVLEGKAPAEDKVIYLESFVPMEVFGLLPLQGLRSDGFKFVQDGEEVSFFNLKDNPLEVRSLPRASSDELGHYQMAFHKLLSGFTDGPTEAAYRGNQLKNTDFEKLFLHVTGTTLGNDFLSVLKMGPRGLTVAEAIQFRESLKEPGPKNLTEMIQRVKKRIEKNYYNEMDHLLLVQLYQLNPQTEIDALTELHLTLKLDPLNPALYQQLGADYQRHKDETGELEVWQLAQAADPHWQFPYLYEAQADMRKTGGKSLSAILAPVPAEDYWFASGLWSFAGFEKIKEKKWQESLGFFEPSLKLNENNLLAREGRGRARLHTGNWDGAMEDFLRIREHDPGSYQRILLSEIAYFSIPPGSRDLELAGKLLAVLEKDNQDTFYVLWAKASIAEAQGDRGKAAQLLEQLSKTEKRDDRKVLIFQKIAELYLAAGNPTKAKEYFHKALTLEPYLAQAANNYAWLVGTEDKNAEEGFKWAYKALSRLPNNPNILDTLAELYFLDDKIDFAIRTEEDALHLAPEDKIFQEHMTKYRDAKTAQSKPAEIIDLTHPEKPIYPDSPK